ncbi:hypothetical protein AGABI2DRAFT_180209 [Agaricus bisporus var. bisporus H97]|uniref:hypothetical protein n=1 Tax=Agaricus bisporus var. bisporus (strain H97 / ATCC MYA-4626 / FGSC 10389) TaxID=936046 RepID=UPI00029F61CC|nr:hypothetical protein AGABI2DRAFT_180209 [Agaricus bisporus var. bisporus H97]EKV44826.1 hypothetical protein AGABI2DRAFT_180209 [Agaricus bisporus var. bisporus H97]
MSSTLTNNQAQTFVHQFYSLWIERVPGHLTNAVNLVVFLIDWTVMLVPYLVYTRHRYDEEDETHSVERYSQMIKTHNAMLSYLNGLSLGCLPALIGVVGNSGLPLCSYAGYATAIAVIFVLASGLATAYLFNHEAGVFKLYQDRFINEWLKASQTPWRKVPNKSFWVILSLPSINCFLCVGLIILIIILTTWGRTIAGTALSLEMQGCTAEKLEIFKYTLLAIFVEYGFFFNVVKLSVI